MKSKMSKVCMYTIGYMVIHMMLISSANSASADLLANGMFEVDEVTSGYVPNDFGDWGGDESEISSGATIPYEGTQVLVLLATGLNGPGATVGSEVWQLIDLSGYKQLIMQGNARAVGESFFNRVAGDSNSDTQFGLTMAAYSGLPGDFLTKWNSGNNLAISSTQLFSDANEQSWESLNLILDLPMNTDYIAFRISATENVYNDLDFPEFDGHFVDATSLTIIPTPAAFAILLPALGLFATRKRRH